MSNDNKTPVVETTIEALEQEIPVVPVAKTKKELKKERKAIKKHKKQVMKEAKMHSAKSTKVFRALVTVVSLVVIASMIFCSFSAIKITQNVMKNAEGTAQEQTTAAQDQTAGDSAQSTPSTPSTPAESTTSAPASDEATTSAPSSEATTDAAESTTQGSANAAADINTKEGAVEYYKTAHAKVLAEAKSVTRTLDNNTNYKEYLEVGGNSTLAGVAKTLMGTFLKANTDPVVHSGADIAANFPPSNNSSAGLTADMIGDYSVKEEGDNYIITLSINSTEENPDLGEKSAHLINIVDAKTVEEAAAGFVSFSGLRNEYIAPTVTATINKTTGQMTALHTITGSYMKFDKATVAVIVNVSNVGIGLQYETEWTIEW